MKMIPKFTTSVLGMQQSFKHGSLNPIKSTKVSPSPNGPHSTRRHGHR